MTLIKLGFVVLSLMVINSIGLENPCPANQCRMNEVLEKGACFLAVGGNCANAINGCSFGASCDDDTKTCTCKTGYIEDLKSGTCTGIIGGYCDCNTDCGGGFACIANTCACPSGTNYDATKMNLMLIMAADGVTNSPISKVGTCVVNVGERCDLTKGPTCITGNCNSANKRCACQYPQAYDATTKKCGCTVDNTYVDSYGNCLPYSGAKCYASELGHDCFCFNHGNGNRKTRNCDAPTNSYW